MSTLEKRLQAQPETYRKLLAMREDLRKQAIAKAKAAPVREAAR